ncbi:sulfate transporter family protein [Parvibaculum sp.]|jgi:CysZ protein|uniref:sulfate transporter family protein n=1 Tax=Parvibaculum sp. TaxID=2024848 RepID=UPI001B004868|nr:sulfate transporter family protein [Parvibaculum sp.]MBO6634082.1 sulfate transporter family protein [Parvibaculum sp.]MBO6677499.1 sulfate transporter family protein [Parvibaculum sp.]MBO6685240.1 sulfate transporter family protein [Parvibaculum sp.]MBO6903461.1 sulfate transporter family protein [Parvibaculum sp.]
MLSDAIRAFRETFSPPFRRVMWLSLVVTAVTLFLFGAGLQWALAALPEFGPDLAGGWVDTILEFVARFLAVIVLIPLVHPVVSLVAGLFLENVAARVEAEDYPADPPGRDQPFWQSLLVAVRFTLVLIAVNLLALPFYLLPVVNIALFWVVNGYLLGREYFELVALRHLPEADVQALRKRHRPRIFLAGVVVALFTTVPILNLLAPLFGTALMVHTYKNLAARRQA